MLFRSKAQVIKDIENALKALTEKGTIVVHDCNPTSEAMQAVPRIQGEWTGDVWKAWQYIRAKYDNLSMCVLDTDYGAWGCCSSRMAWARDGLTVAGRMGMMDPLTSLGKCQQGPIPAAFPQEGFSG